MMHCGGVEGFIPIDLRVDFISKNSASSWC